MTESEAFIKLRDYFQSIANSFDDMKLASTIFPNSIDMGSTREDILMEFLKRHLPKRCDVIKGGFVFDRNGNTSKQIDLIITNDLTIQFKQFTGDASTGKSFNVVEGCYGIISVKSTLNKDELFDSLNNVASIPQMPELQMTSNVFNPNRIHDLPFSVIFAYNGLDMKTIKSHMEDYFSKNNIPDNRKPNLIIVNNKCSIARTHDTPEKTASGRDIPPYTYMYQDKFQYVGAHALWSLLYYFQIVVNFGPHMIQDFSSYAYPMFKSFNLPK